MFLAWGGRLIIHLNANESKVRHLPQPTHWPKEKQRGSPRIGQILMPRLRFSSFSQISLQILLQQGNIPAASNNAALACYSPPSKTNKIILIPSSWLIVSIIHSHFSEVQTETCPEHPYFPARGSLPRPPPPSLLCLAERSSPPAV